ncbi:hypothetical protein [Lapillicoccus jejuensis]|uniref:Integral membrane protein n=1 Tax=Lapillicoccus jejuensis TaxID=402171 RepID=A0A542E6Y3_9MICO|nr:hypothetical protein [Lapillicoccus jejuensis]TQJ11074.1 hypothetical protein FB458_4223 [Lapillicoccus jejuensis]
MPEQPAAAPTPVPDDREPTDHGSGRRGFGVVLVALYALFALAATGRATYQIIAEFDRAPVAYLLSALAAVVYLVATVALFRGDRLSLRVARASITVELVGVLVVGLLSYLQPADFPDKTVWSHFGSGYGYLPLVLPVVGLWWLRRTGRP